MKQIMERNRSKPWDTSWYNKYDSIFAKKKKVKTQKNNTCNFQYIVFPVLSTTLGWGLISVYNFGFTLDQYLAILSILYR